MLNNLFMLNVQSIYTGVPYLHCNLDNFMALYDTFLGYYHRLYTFL